MPATASRSIETSPTLFRLRTLPGTTLGGATATTMTRPRRRSLSRTDANANRGALRLRIDPPHVKRPPRWAGRNNEEATSPAPPARDPAIDARSKDLFTDHAGDLIARLGQWSLQLDRREAELDRRQRELNQLLRLLRQHPQAE
ncbi:hypothetical protein [Stieleria mannarensis]|uniref:hypothetical protein n=1 Tax=Stieleria mannarensis TaxID=2755585 RepID=UPI0015FFACA6|nr:hypothetical protein [Rhodopirellula sp. JC639]